MDSHSAGLTHRGSPFALGLHPTITRISNGEDARAGKYEYHFQQPPPAPPHGPLRPGREDGGIMTSNLTGLTLVAVGASTAVVAGLGLLVKLMGREPDDPPTIHSFVSTWSGIWLITLVKYWSWKEDGSITGICLLGTAIFIAGLMLR